MSKPSSEIRREFLEFFAQRGHTIVPGGPVVPHDDPTLMFTNAGMNQFKPIFLGQQAPDVDRWQGATPGSPTRAADTQPCIRAGGKHNDLDDVGHDTYHHTMFEMLGNWSFGDYFKREAIQWAWELLTEVWGLDKERLYATYFGGTEARRHEGTKGGAQGAGRDEDVAARAPARPSDADHGSDLEPDHEARDLWLEMTDIDPSHVMPFGAKDNFWEMGDTGPCGPCSEIHIDLTPDKSGGPLVNVGDPRVMEIWNLVFIQYNRAADGKLSPLPAKHVDTGMGFERIAAVLQGMAAGKLGDFSNYDTDVFGPIFAAIREATGAPQYTGLLEEGPRGQGDEGASEGAKGSGDQGTEGPRDQGDEGSRDASAQSTSAPGSLDPSVPAVMVDISYRVIADHIRTLVFAMADGALPDRDGRGYVLRRILRRAVRYGWQYMNVRKPFLCDLVPAVVGSMGNAFPHLREQAGRIVEVLRDEEESFERTLERGIKFCGRAAVRAAYRVLEPREHLIGPLPPPGESGPRGPVTHEGFFSGDPDELFDLDGGYFGLQHLDSPFVRERYSAEPTISGEDAFKLHDTFGFAIDLTQIMAAERGIAVDVGEFERLMEIARDRAKNKLSVSDQFTLTGSVVAELIPSPTTDGAKHVSMIGSAECRGRFDSASFLTQERVIEGQEQVALILDQTCFYAEQGGQVGDRGLVSSTTGTFRVVDTQLLQGVVLHIGHVEDGYIDPGQAVELAVAETRRFTMQNHTATHILNWALRETLGDHVQQKGSLVDPDKTRFDFSNPKALTADELARIESLCGEQIVQDLEVHTNDNEPVAQADAMKINGLRAVFGEKYPEQVRVVSIGVPITEAEARRAGQSEWLLGNPDNDDWRKYSIEFCGGTHVKRTSEIESFTLVSEEAVAKGIRRLVGVTGQAARDAIARGEQLLEQASRLQAASRLETGSTEESQLRESLGELQRALAEETIPVTARAKLRDAITELQKTAKQQQKQAAAASADVVKQRIADMLADAPKVGETTVVVGEMPDVPVDQLKTGADIVKQKCGSAAILLGCAGEKALLLAAMTDDLIKRGVKAGDLVKQVAKIVKGGGGGPPTMAQAGGKDPSKLGEALEAGRAWIVERLG